MTTTADKITLVDAVKIIESELAIRNDRIDTSIRRRNYLQKLMRRRRFLNKEHKRNDRRTDSQQS